MFYVAHLQGRGQGCDYTIACNEKFVTIGGVASVEEASSKILEDYGGDLIGSRLDGPRIESITVYACESEHEIDVDAYRRGVRATVDAENAKAVEAAERAQLEALQTKYGKT